MGNNLRRFLQGKYKVKNKEKYVGDVDVVQYRSSLELRFFKFLDFNQNVRYWNSEEIVIPYIHPIDNRYHRYFPDLFFELHNNQKFLIEIKPSTQTKINEKSSLNDKIVYKINKAKWDAAGIYAKDNNLTFLIITEKNFKTLGIKEL